MANNAYVCMWCSYSMAHVNLLRKNNVMKTLAEHILVLNDAMPLDMCKALIETYDSVSKDDEHYEKRDNAIYKFDEINMLNHSAFEDFKEPMGALMKAVNNFYMDKVHNILRDKLVCYEPLKDYEAPRIKRYEPNEGVFDWHVDSFDEASAKRALVMFWYLNDVEEGGETVFDIGEEVKVEPKAGTVCCFPPHWTFPHKGATPISGPKYVISSYVWLPNSAPLCDPINK